MGKQMQWLLCRFLLCLGVLLGSTQGHAATPETTAPETTAPETTAPETTAPETTAPETATPRLLGKFVWAELVTHDIASAQHFYGGLFGWTFAEVDGYVTAFNGEEPVAGLYYRAAPKDQSAKPRWICSVSAENLDEVSRAAQAAGGSVRLPPAPIPGLGTRTVLADSEGALFGAIRLTQGDPEDYLAETGSWIWLQLLSSDIAKASHFYQALGGYELYDDRKPGQKERYLLVRDGYSRAAISPLSPQRVREGVKPLWLPFIRVDSVAASLAQVSALGGKVVLPPRQNFHQGRIAVIEDATGGAVGLMEWDAEPEPDTGIDQTETGR